jgi:hypothetical protein
MRHVAIVVGQNRLDGSNLAKTKIVSNVLYYTQETRREITEINSMILATMSRLEKFEKDRGE